jgi:tetratricopeptide (TPR) repeat protein
MQRNATMPLPYVQIAPPKSWEAFEDLCHALYQAAWQDGNAQKHGRPGQAQSGVDIFGQNHRQGGGWWGVQCKRKRLALGSRLTQTEFDAELAESAAFDPPLACLIIATTSPSDTALQAHARSVSEARKRQGLGEVTIHFWENIEQLLFAHQDVTRIYYPQLFAQLGQPVTRHLPAISLSDYFSDPLNHLGTLRQQLQSGGSAAVVAAATVQGMGGVGKTQLALKYCLSYPDYAGIWWFSAENPGMLEQDCITFCAKQAIPLAKGEPAAPVMCNWLCEPGRSGRWLLVFDNAEDEKLLRPYLPQGTPHHVIITSRRPGWGKLGKLALDVWQVDDALPFLRDRLQGVLDTDDAQLVALTALLGGLPLALEQACAYINNNQVTLADYHQRLSAQDSALDATPALLAQEASEFCNRSVLATLSLAFEKLSPAAQALLGICGWLAAEPIPEYLFTENSDDIWAALPAPLQAVLPDQFAWRETVAELRSYALCQTEVLRMTDHVGNGASEVFCLSLHRLTQAAVRASPHGQNAGALALGVVRAAFPGGANSPEYPPAWPRCRSLLPHVQRLQTLYQPGWQPADRLAWLLTELALYLKSGPAQYPQAKELVRQTLQMRQTALGEEHPETLTAMNNLAVTLWQMGDLPGARDMQEAVLTIRRRVLGEEHPDTLISMGNLAETLRQMGDLPGARAMHEAALTAHRRVQGEEHPDTLISMGNLALTLWQMGDLPGARAMQEVVLTTRRRVLGEEHPATLISMGNLAATLRQMGDLPGARAMQQAVLTTSRRVLGEEHPDTLRSMHNLAVTCYDLGRLQDAQTLMQQAYQGFCRVLGPEHPHTLRSQQWLAKIIAAQA